MASRGLTRQKANRNLLNVQYMKRIEDEMKDMMANFSQTFKERGAICDSEGFYQHTGQCWSDAIQMIFLWSDGLKEVVQHRLATSVIDDTFLSDVDDSALLNSQGYNGLNKEQQVALARKFKHSASEYFKIVQHRFMRHYTTEVERRKLHETCSSNIPESRYYSRLVKISGLLHMKGKNAIQSEILAKKEGHRENAGGYDEDIAFLLYLYSLTFFNGTLEFHMSETFPSTTPYAHAVFISVHKKTSTSGHALCFYTCGGIDFLYEDNYGPVPFNWRSLCQHIEDLINRNYRFNVVFTSCKIKTNEYLYETEFFPLIHTQGVYLTYFNNELITIDGDSYSNNNIEIKVKKEMYEVTGVYGIVNKDAVTVENKGFEFVGNSRLFNEDTLLAKMVSFIDDNDIYSLKRILQNQSIDVNHVFRDSTGENISPLIFAIKKNSLEAVDLLLKNPKINVNHEIHNRKINLGEDLSVYYNPLTAAFFYAKTKIEIVKRLLEEPLLNINKSISDDGSTILHVVIQLHDVNGMPEKLGLLLLRNDINVNVHTRDGASPLLYAYGLERFDFIDLLCSKGAVHDFPIVSEDRQYFSKCAVPRPAGSRPTISKPPLKTRKNRKAKN